MAILAGLVKPLEPLLFVAQENTANLLKGLDYSTISESNGSYNITLAEGTYTIHISDRIYKNVTIDGDGSLNDFLEKANGGNL